MFNSVVAVKSLVNTEKSYKQESNNTYVFYVDVYSDKPSLYSAFEMLYGQKPLDVRTAAPTRKIGVFKRVRFESRGYKKVYVRFAKEVKISKDK